VKRQVQNHGHSKTRRSTEWNQSSCVSSCGRSKNKHEILQASYTQGKFYNQDGQSTSPGEPLRAVVDREKNESKTTDIRKGVRSAMPSSSPSIKQQQNKSKMQMTSMPLFPPYRRLLLTEITPSSVVGIWHFAGTEILGRFTLLPADRRTADVNHLSY